MGVKQLSRNGAVLAAMLAVLTVAGSGYAQQAPAVQPQTIQLAQGRQGSSPPELQPRYQPAAPEETSWYNSSYIFGMTRSVAGSTMVPAAKVPLFVLTVPLDIVFLPFAAIGGLFG
jgi:hypothetical protein